MEPDRTFTRDDVLAMLSGTPERIRDFVTAVEAPLLDYRHGPAFPSVAEVILHVWAAGIAADTVIKGACLDGSPPGDPDAALDPPAITAGDGADPVDKLDDLARNRRRTMDLLRGIGDARWEQELSGDRVGPVALIDFCRLVAAHELGHLSQVRNLTALLPE